LSLLDELLLGPEPTQSTTTMSNGNGLLSGKREKERKR